MAGMSLPLSPHSNSGPLLLSSPIDVSSLHVAQAAGLRAAQQEHVGLEEQKGGESTWLSPFSLKLPPTAPGAQPALGHHSPGRSSPYAGGQCPRRRCHAISASGSCRRIRGEIFILAEQREWGLWLFLSPGPACVCPSFLHDWDFQIVGSSATVVASHLHDRRTAEHRGRHRTHLSHPYPPYLRVAGTFSPLATGWKCWSFPRPMFSSDMTP